MENCCGQTTAPSKEQVEKIKAERTLRNKSWEQLTADEKIERLREIIKDLQRSLSYTQRDVRNCERLFTHDHKDGEVISKMIKDNSDSFGTICGQLSGTPNYF